MKGKLHKMVSGYILSLNGDIDDPYAIANKELAENYEWYRLSLKNCQAIELGYDLDDLAKFYSTSTVFIKGNEIPTDKQIEDAEHISEIAFKEGFKKCLEFFSGKYFTLDDIYTVFIMGREGMEDKMNKYVDRIHEPLEWDVEIEMEPYHEGNFVDDGNTHPIEVKWRPAKDEDGCLILKRI